MAEANVEALRRGYEALNRGDLSFVLELIDRDIEWNEPHPSPEAGRHTGRDSFKRFFGSWIDSFDGFKVEPELVIERDDKLIAVVHQSGRGRASGVQVDARLAHVWTVKDGRAIRWEAIADPEDALGGASPAVELVRRALAALNAGDMERLIALCDRDFELDMSDRVFNPSTYRGHDGIRQFHSEVLEVWDHYTWEPEQVFCHGGLVVALLCSSGEGRGSGLEVERQTAMIWTVRGNKATSLRFYRDQDRALAAAASRDQA